MQIQYLIYVSLAINLIFIAWLIIDAYRIFRKKRKASKQGFYSSLKEIKQKNNKFKTPIYIFLIINCFVCIALIIINGGI